MIPMSSRICLFLRFPLFRRNPTPPSPLPSFGWQSFEPPEPPDLILTPPSSQFVGVVFPSLFWPRLGFAPTFDRLMLPPGLSVCPWKKIVKLYENIQNMPYLKGRIVEAISCCKASGDQDVRFVDPHGAMAADSGIAQVSRKWPASAPSSSTG